MSGTTAPSTYISGHTLAQFVIVALAANIIVNLSTILFDFFELVILPNTTAGDVIALEETSWLTLLKGGLYLLEVAVRLTTAILFLIWIHRVYKNLRSLDARNLEFSPGWAVGWFFIPIANLFVPYRVVKEIWVKSDPGIDKPVETWQRNDTPALLPLWWGFWIVSTFAGRIADNLLDKAETPEQLFLYTKFEIVASALTIGAAVCAILVVRGIDRRQEERSKQQTLHLPPSPPIFTPQQAQL